MISKAVQISALSVLLRRYYYKAGVTIHFNEGVSEENRLKKTI